MSLLKGQSNEKIIELGRINYEDVNLAPTDNEIFFDLAAIPSGYYPEKIYQITEVFDAGVQSIATGVNTNAYLDANANTLTIVQLADSANVTQDYDDLQFRITFDSSNPQNLTSGSITIKTLILKYPI